jgi:hypothetical protein
VALTRPKEHNVVVPAFTVTTPVGLPSNWGLTVAVNVSTCSSPKVTVGAESVSRVVVDCWGRTVRVRGAEVETARRRC